VAWHLDTTNKDLGGMLGWPHVVAQVAAAYQSLAPRERSSATILAGDYSEAGAIDFWRADYGLPPAISPHNSYWLWGYGGDHAGAVIVVGLGRRTVERYWADVQPFARLGDDGAAIDPQERGAMIWICRDQKIPWSTIWRELRSYD
jgi:hypothetical protein